MANFSLGEAVLGTGVDLAGLTKGMGAAKNEAQGAASGLGDVFKGALSVAGGFIITNVLGAVTSAFGQLFTFIGDGIGKASDMNETVSKVGVIFGDSASQVLAFADTAATALGQSRQSALDAASTFATFGKSAGLGGADLVQFSTKLTGLASDLASFNNTTPEQAIQAIGAALRGETEPMRAYGVLLDDASMRQKAFEMGIISSTKNALTPAQKVLAAQALILEQTTLAQGDFARTSTGAANQSRIFAAQVENLQTKMGSALYPAMEAVYSIANTLLIPAFSSFADNVLPGLVGVVTDLSGAFTGFFQDLAAGDIEQAISGLGEWDSLKGLIKFLGLGNGKLYDFAATVSDVFIGVTKAFSVFGDDTAGGIANVLYYLDQFAPGLAIVGDVFLAVTDAVTTFFSEIGRGTDPLVALHAALGDLFPADLVYLIWDIQDAFAALLGNDPATFFEKLSDIGAGLQTIFANIAANVGTWLGQIVPPVIAWIQQQIPIWVTTLQSWGAAFVAWIGPQIPPILSALGGLATSLLAWLGEQVPVLVAGLYAWGTELINWIAPQVGPMLAQAGTFLGSLTGWIIGTGIPQLATNLATMAQELWKWITDVAVPQIGPALLTFKTTLDTFFTDTLIPGLVTFGTNFVTALLDGMGVKMPQDLVTAINGAMTAIQTAITGIDWASIGGNIISGITGGISAGAGAIADAARGAAMAALDAAKAALGIQSPSKAFYEVGDYSMQGMEQGITDNAGAPMDAVRAASTDLLTAAAPQAPGVARGATGGGNTFIFNFSGTGPTLSQEEIKRMVESALLQVAANTNVRLQLGY